MIWALLAAYLLSSLGGAEFSALFQPAKMFIQTDIEDKARRNELLAVVADAEKTTDAQMKIRVGVVKELSVISARHDARTEDLGAVFERFRVDTETYQEQIVKHRFELKTKMSREEWVKAFATETIAPAQK